MRRQFLICVTLAAAFGASAGDVRARAGLPPALAIDVERSTLTISVYKSGLFSAFADNHVVRARLTEGSLTSDPPAAASIVVHARDLEVLDPGLPADKRREVQARMLGPEVLDADRYAEIAFASTAIQAAGSDHWTVTGELRLHGRARTLTFDVARSAGAYHGRVRIRQSDFGITPISIAGGTVKVKDELLVEFSIVARDLPAA
jgi:polyisoprenoid-binding protein YceI